MHGQLLLLGALAGLVLAPAGNAASASSRATEQSLARRSTSRPPSPPRPSAPLPPADGVQIQAGRGRIYVDNQTEYTVNIYLSKDRQHWRPLGSAPAQTVSYGRAGAGRWWFYGETEVLNDEGLYYSWGPSRFNLRKQFTFHLQ